MSIFLFLFLSRKKKRISLTMSKSVLKRTDVDNIITNLRGELGSIIEVWTLMREQYIVTNQLASDDLIETFRRPDFNKSYIIKKKLTDDIISRLSELSNKSYGKLNFYFATQKLGMLNLEFEEYRDFIVKHNFKARRDEFISHKKLPITWEAHKAAHRVPYLTILKAIAKALILMKKIDKIFLGENSNINWQKLRNHRYTYDIPARAKYMMMYYVK